MLTRRAEEGNAFTTGELAKSQEPGMLTRNDV